MKIKSKFYAVLVYLFFGLFIKAQYQLKSNALFLPVGILNVAVEKPVGNKKTLQGEILISPWKSFAGIHLLVGMLTVDGRYYFKNVQKGWYMGPYFSAAAFNLQKWNYMKATPDYWAPTTYNDDGTIKKSEKYQKGYTFILGAVTGYKLPLNEKWGMEFYIGVGNSQGIYKGYYKDTDERYDIWVKKWNKSGEWLISRGGIMITYAL